MQLSFLAGLRRAHLGMRKGNRTRVDCCAILQLANSLHDVPPANSDTVTSADVMCQIGLVANSDCVVVPTMPLARTQECLHVWYFVF